MRLSYCTTVVLLPHKTSVRAAGCCLPSSIVLGNAENYYRRPLRLSRIPHNLKHEQYLSGCGVMLSKHIRQMKPNQQIGEHDRAEASRTCDSAMDDRAVTPDPERLLRHS